MKRFFTYLKTELKLSLRDMNMPVFAVVMPLMILQNTCSPRSRLAASTANSSE